MEKEKKNNKKKVIIIISIILGVLLVGSLSYITYDKAFKKDNETKEETTKDENNNQEEKDSTSVSSDFDYNFSTKKIYKQFGSLFSVGYFKDMVYNGNLKIDSNGNLKAVYDEGTKEIKEISNAKKVFSIGLGGALATDEFVLTNNGEIYIVSDAYSYDNEITVKKVEISKKVVNFYECTQNINTYIVFEDGSIGILERNGDYDWTINENVENLNDVIDYFSISGQCSQFCDPLDIIVKADGDIKILKSIDDSGKEEYVNVTYNNKELDLKYLYLDYDEASYSNFNFYFVDTDNNVYVLKDYYKDEKRPTNLEKLIYKFDSYQITTTSEYTVKYDNGSTLKIENFIDLSKYSKVFEAFNN